MGANSYADDLEHYGVLGMKWGVRKQKDKVARKPKKPRTTSEDIRKARDRQSDRAKKINSLSEKLDTTKKKSDAHKKILAEIQKQGDKYINNPDAAMAKRLTAGEKLTIGLLATAGGLSMVAKIGVATAGRR